MSGKGYNFGVDEIWTNSRLQKAVEDRIRFNYQLYHIGLDALTVTNESLALKIVVNGTKHEVIYSKDYLMRFTVDGVVQTLLMAWQEVRFLS